MSETDDTPTPQPKPEEPKEPSFLEEVAEALYQNEYESQEAKPDGPDGPSVIDQVVVSLYEEELEENREWAELLGVSKPKKKKRKKKNLEQTSE